MERYPRIYDHIYYLELNGGMPEFDAETLFIQKYYKKGGVYNPSETVISNYIKTYNELCDTEKLLETMREKLTEMTSNSNYKLPLIRRIIIAISKRKTSTKIENAELTCKQLEKELDRLINTDVIQKKRKKYREENPWPEGFI